MPFLFPYIDLLSVYVLLYLSQKRRKALETQCASAKRCDGGGRVNPSVAATRTVLFLFVLFLYLLPPMSGFFVSWVFLGTIYNGLI